MEYFPYEGAGFLLSFNDFVILGQRIKKAEDLAKDPVTELEYMGGKIDPQDGNDPYKTASAELAEELGADILEKDWATSKRLNIVHMFQPFSKKWIWCFCLDLTPEEFARLREACRQLDDWPRDKLVSFENITGRTTLA